MFVVELGCSSIRIDFQSWNAKLGLTVLSIKLSHSLSLQKDGKSQLGCFLIGKNAQKSLPSTSSLSSILWREPSSQPTRRAAFNGLTASTGKLNFVWYT